jgi:serine/threonine protein phosphatase PrpC
MTETKQLIGALSNDLFRIASLSHRGSEKAALRFAQEASKRVADLQDRKVKQYIRDVIGKINDILSEENQLKENCDNMLMYSVLLQNYCLQSE